MNAFKGIPVRPGVWSITSVLINELTVMNHDGFLRLEVSENQISIQPIGLGFTVAQSTSRSAVLQAGGEIYFAEFCFTAEEFELTLKRPQFNECVKIQSEFTSGVTVFNRFANSAVNPNQRFDMSEI